MRLALTLLLLATVCATGECFFNKTLNLALKAIRERMERIRQLMIQNMLKIKRQIQSAFENMRRIFQWQRAYPKKALWIVSKSYVVEGDRYITGLKLTKCSTRRILTSMEGMTLAAVGLSEGFAKILKLESVDQAAQAKFKEVFDLMVQMDKNYNKAFAKGNIVFRGKKFSTAQYGVDVSLIKEMAKFMHLNAADRGKKTAELKSSISKAKISLDAVKKFILDAARADGRKFVRITEQEPLKCLLFIYYRGIYLLNLQRVLGSKGGLTNVKDIIPERDFIKAIDKVTKVDLTPPKENPKEQKGKSTSGSITVNVNGKETTVTLKNANKYVESQSKEIQSTVVSLTELLSNNNLPSLLEIDGKTKTIRVSLHITLIIYRFVHENRKNIMSTYAEMKETIIKVFDYLSSVLSSAMESAEPTEEMLQQVGPAVQTINTLMPKLRAAYTKNDDDKAAYIKEYREIYKKSDEIVDGIMRKESTRKNSGFMKMLALCRIIAKIERSSFCVFSGECTP